MRVFILDFPNTMNIWGNCATDCTFFFVSLMLGAIRYAITWTSAGKSKQYSSSAATSSLWSNSHMEDKTLSADFGSESSDTLPNKNLA
jgi:hypothetical protein